MVTKQDLETLEERLIGTGNNLQNNQNFLQEQILNVEQLMPVLRNIKRTEWKQVGDILSGDYYNERFGTSLDISKDGNSIIIGARMSGTITVFKWNNIINNWEQKGQSIIGDFYFRTGYKVGIANDGDVIAISEINYSEDITTYDRIGKITCYKYESINNNWEILGNPIVGDFFNSQYGLEIKLSKNNLRLAIKAGNNPDNDFLESVIVYEFNNNNNDWEKIGNTIFAKNPFSRFANSMDISNDGNILAIGAWSYDDLDNNNRNLGRVIVYKYDSNEWSKLGNEIIGDIPYEEIGYPVSLSGDGKLLAISSPANSFRSTNLPYVKVFNFSDNNWNQLGDTIFGDNKNFGFTISITSDAKLVIGSYYENNYSGKIYYFELINNKWIEKSFPIVSNNAGYLGIRTHISDDGKRIISSGYATDGFKGSVYSFELEKIEPGELYYGKDYKLKIMQ